MLSYCKVVEITGETGWIAHSSSAADSGGAGPLILLIISDYGKPADTDPVHVIIYLRAAIIGWLFYRFTER